MLALVFASAWNGRPALAQVTETVIHSFAPSGDGIYPYAGVIVGDGGEIYGTTGYGGNTPAAGCGGPGNGTVFKLTPPRGGQAAWTEKLLWSFTGGQDGCAPWTTPFAFHDSSQQKMVLWGTTFTHGKYNAGTIFRLEGTSLSTLWAFGSGIDGGGPLGQLAADRTGAIYGTTIGGGSFGNGTVFRIDPLTGTLTTIWSFSGTDGSNPAGPLLIDDSGVIYGTTGSGGLTNSSNGACYSNGCGTVFKPTPPKHDQSTWTFTTLYFFTGNADGAIPAGPYAEGGLVADKSGALYGTTYTGGTFGSICDSFGCGVVFKLTPPASGHGAWTETVIWSFSGFSDGDGGNGPLIIDRKGALYGTTQFGGIIPQEAPCLFDIGCGIAFKLTPPPPGETAWTETTLWSFTGFSDGQTPVAGLVADKKGALYGATQNGGITGGDCTGYGCGVVFKLDGTGFAPGGGDETAAQ